MGDRAFPKTTRDVYREVAEINDSSQSEVIEVIDHLWKSVSHFIAEDRFNAIYIRGLGTFYGKKEIAYMIEKKKNKQ